jgi:hypothetical protein
MMKLICITALAATFAFSFAQDKKDDCSACEKMATTKTQAKAQKKDECSACDKMATTKTQVKAQKKDECSACDKMATTKSQTKDGKEACCKSTEAKPIGKGDKGCCNAKGANAKYKVYVAYEGYKFFGCEGSAKQAREEFVKQGYIVGNVQKVNSKVSM